MEVSMSPLAHFACFPCRKAFKKRVPMEWRPRKGWFATASPTCPQCRQRMHHMGKSFRAPRQRDVEQWSKVEALRRNDVYFVGRSLAPELLPTRFREVERFLAEIATKSQGKRELERAASNKAARRHIHRNAAPPPVRFSSKSRIPFARKTFKRLRVGWGADAELPLRQTLGVQVTLAWRPGPALYLVKTTLPKHTVVHGVPNLRLPRRLRPGDWLKVGDCWVGLNW